MIFAKLNQQQFDTLSHALLDEEGIALEGTSGRIEKNGVGAEYSYDGTVLTIRVVHKPFLVTMAYCEDKLREALQERGVVVSG